MSSYKFCGAVARRFFTWGYTCEFCGKEVVKRDSVSAQHGETYKSTSMVTISGAGAEMMKIQALQQLAVSVAQKDKNIKSGQFEVPKAEDGRCPHCKNYQHWSTTVLNARRGGGNAAQDRVIIGILTVVIGILLGTIINLSLYPMLKGHVIVQDVIFLIVVPATWPVVRILVKKIRAKKNARNAEMLKALEDIEKTNPHFIAWGEESSEIVGLTEY